jgi:hypothetical protein
MIQINKLVKNPEKKPKIKQISKECKKCGS